MSPIGALLSLRRRGYEAGWFRSETAAVPVISIGNLTWGGTGKTPFTLWLAADLAASGRRVGIVSRGYGRRSSGLRVVSEGAGPRLTVEEAGDEPTLFARRLPAAIVVVAERRIEGARRAVELGADVLVLDDAFQHLAIRRDLDVVLLDAGDPFGGGLPPIGRSREPATVLSRADLIVLTRAFPQETAETETLVRRSGSNAPIYHAAIRFAGWFDESGEAARAPAPGDVCVATAAIASPGRFEATLRQQGIAPAAFFRFRDHHFYSGADLRRIERAIREAGARALLTTEKDQVKLRERLSVPVVAARVEVEIAEPGLPGEARRILAARGHGV